MANKSIKHLQINKSQTKILVVIGITTAVVIFCLFATKALISKGMYQNRALSARRAAASQLQSNYNSAQTLFTQYQSFAQQNPNVLGGNATGSGALDGDNARIVLDALPSNYDAPALGSSIEKILIQQGIAINSLSIIDDPSANSDAAEANPQPKVITFTFAGSTTYAGLGQLLQAFEHSIRPFDVYNLGISGTDTNLGFSISVNTYYQPPKSLDLSTFKDVK